MRNLFLCFSVAWLSAANCGFAYAEGGCSEPECTDAKAVSQVSKDEPQASAVDPDISSPVTEEDGDTANKGEGFYWYHDKKQPDRQAETSYPSYQELWDMDPDEFAELLEDRKKLAIQFPTEENVYRYLEIQDVAKRKSVAFAAVMGLVAQKHPEFSTENHYPLNVPGQRALTKIKNEELDTYLNSVKEQYALIVFVQDGCKFCETQKPILDMFIAKYGWTVKYLDLKQYTDLADRYAVTVTPSILVLSKDQQEAMPITSGVIALSELSQRLFRSVKYLRGEIKPEQFYMTKKTSDPLKFVADHKEGDDE